MNSPRSRPAPQHSGPAEGAVAGFETLYRANVTAVIISGPVPICVSLPGPPDGGSSSSSVTPPG
jgi:hypothetical protein